MTQEKSQFVRQSTNIMYLSILKQFVSFGEEEAKITIRIFRN